MTDFTTNDLDDLVERGLAEKRGDTYVASDLAKAMAYAIENWTPAKLPPEGVRYLGYQITAIVDPSTTELIFSFNRAMQ